MPVKIHEYQINREMTAELVTAVQRLMANQQFDHGGHPINPVPPAESAVIEAKILLEKFEE